MAFRLKRGLDIPISGIPEQKIEQGPACRSVGLIGRDYIGMKPTMLVKEGDTVSLGQPVFQCKKNEGLLFTSPAGGKVKRIHRGERRRFESLEIEVASSENSHSFSSFQNKDIRSLSAQQVRQLLVESGLWTSIRQRPFNKVAPVDGEASAIFVSILDTQPLSIWPEFIIAQNSELFVDGLNCLAKLTEGKVFVGAGPGSKLKTPDNPKIQIQQFEGPHPAGNVGTQMHFVLPPTSQRLVWHVGYQDVVSIGHLFRSGKLFTDRYIAVGGPACRSPQVLKTRLGANLNEVLAGSLSTEQNVRVISGSVLHGRSVDPDIAFLGRYDNQVSLLFEGNQRKFLGWHAPGVNQFSAKPIFVSKLLPKKNFNLNTSTHGSKRALVPFGLYERVCPLDTMATPLLKALLARDTDTAQDLGILELAEEDVALFSFVCTGKTNFGPILRENLELIEKEG